MNSTIDFERYEEINARVAEFGEEVLTKEDKEFLTDAADKARNVLRDKVGHTNLDILAEKFIPAGKGTEFYQGMEHGLLCAVDLLNQIEPSPPVLGEFRVADYRDVTAIVTILLSSVMMMEDKGLISKFGYAV